MQFEQVSNLVSDVPFMAPENGRMIYDFIRNSGVKECLELGIGHGVGSCYMGAALQETGGHLTTVDRFSARDRKPNVEDLLKKTGLESVVSPKYVVNSYTWQLLELIEEHTEGGVCRPYLDFCFIDGAHLFEPDACAFFLADKLLKPGAWLLFDDMFWTLGSSEFCEEEWVKQLTPAERDSPHISKVFDCLVRQHPEYGDFRVVGQWAWARKRGGDASAAGVLDAIGVNESFKGYLKRYLRPWYRKAKRWAGRH